MKTHNAVSTTGRWIAGVLFAAGIVWAVPAVVLLGEYAGNSGRLTMAAFWISGLAIWLGWGVVALARVTTRTVRAIWLTSLVFHLALLIVSFLFLAGTAATARFGESWWWVLPGWWVVAAAASLVGYVCETTRRDRRARE